MWPNGSCIDSNTILEFGSSLTQPYKTNLLSDDCPPLINIFSGHILSNIRTVNIPENQRDCNHETTERDECPTCLAKCLIV
jgi:hypothetical protein